MAHRLAQFVQSVDETGRTVVHLAEGRDEDVQFRHRRPEVAIAPAPGTPPLSDAGTEQLTVIVWGRR